jgi:endonuclease/exonuclease/phosphatase family metal-dependent hydrolase
LQVVSVPGSPSMGGKSKSAVGVLVEFPQSNRSPMWVVSVHLGFNMETRVRLLQAIELELTGGYDVLLAGDLNVEPGSLPEVEQQTLLQRLRRVGYQPDTHTAAGKFPDFQPECIDHVYAPAAFTATRVSVEAGGVPCLPYGAVPIDVAGVECALAPISSASDHQWVSVEFGLSPLADPTET